MSLVRPQMIIVSNFNTLWPSIKPFLIKLLKVEPIQGNDWQNLFLLVHRLCLWDRSGPTLLRISIEKYTVKFVKKICKRLMVHNNNIDLLKAYVIEWKTYFLQCNYLPVPFKEMEMAIVGKSVNFNNLHHNDFRVDMTKKMMLDCWYTFIFNGIKERLQSAAMELLYNERNGDISVTRDIIDIKESFVNLCTDVEDSLKTYKDYFEQPYIEATESFYKLKAVEYLEEHGVQKYLPYAHDKLKEEKIRAERYLQTPGSVKKLTDTCTKLLVTNFQSAILYDYKDMIKRNDITQLQGLYKIMKSVPDGNARMEKEFEELIVNISLTDIMASGNTTNQKSDKYVTQLLELFHRFSNIVHRAFENDPRYLTVRDKAYRSVVNDKTMLRIELNTTQINTPEVFHSESKCPELLANYCDMLLRRTTLSKRLTSHEIENKLNGILLVLKYVQNKDIFLRYHTAHLSRRLILETSIDSEKDECMVESLKKIGIHGDYVHKLTRMFQDTKISHDLSNDFKNMRAVNDNSTDTVSIKILNSSAWIVGSEYVNVSLPIELEDHIPQIEQFYKTKHNGRKLLWCHHMSSSTIIFSNDIGTFDVDITTFQMAVLFIWNRRPNDKITFENLKLATELPDIELRKTLWSLVALKKLKNQILLVSPEVSSPKDFDENTTFWINKQFCLVKNGIDQKRGKLNLIGRLQLYTEQNKEEDRKSIIQLRTLRVQEGIIKILKMRQKISKINLEKEIIEILNNMFMPSKKMIKEQIEWLIEQNFIKRDDSDINMFVYIT